MGSRRGARGRPLQDASSPSKVTAALLAAVVAGTVGCWGTSPADPGPADDPIGARPNVLVIVTDDQRDGTLSVMPETRRWLAAGGTRFTQAFATTPLCCPSRATIFTGRYAHNHGVQTNLDAEDLDQDITLQRYLRDAGYLTAISGKFLNRWDLRVTPPYFDRWSIFDSGYEGRRFNVDGRLRRIDRYSTDFVAQRSVQYLREFDRRDASPWFLYVATAAPHGPFTPPARYLNAPVPPWKPTPAVRASVPADKPSFFHSRGRSLQRTEQVRADQLRTLMAVDDLVGGVIRELRTLEELDDTLIFFLSDNGYLWADHGLGTKRVPYTPSIKVPFLVRWPGALGAGEVDERPVITADIAPTVLQAAGVGRSVTARMDGRSLWGEPRPFRLLLEYWREPLSTTPTWASVRTADRQYVEYYGRSGRVVARELYSLANDPWQLRNLLADPDGEMDPADVRGLSRWLSRARSCEGIRGPRACP